MGVVVVPLSPLLRAPGLGRLLADADPALLILSPDLAEQIEPLREGLALPPDRCLLTGPADRPGYRSYSRLTAKAPPTEPAAATIPPEAPYNIMYTSGTTGQPRGIVLTHRIRAMYGLMFSAAYRISAESVVLHAGSLAFNGAFLTLMPAFYSGATYILQPRFDPARLIETAAREAGYTVVVGGLLAGLARAADPPVYTEQAGSNPLSGVTEYYPKPAFVDIDGDGDWDVSIGESGGTINYYKNTGSAASPTFVEQTGADNPFDSVDVGWSSTPTFADIDDDGDQDALIGESSGDIFYYENTGTAGAPVFTPRTGGDNPFDGVALGNPPITYPYDAAPAFVDIDDDGDQDLFVAEKNSGLHYYQANGAPTAAGVSVSGTPAEGATLTGSYTYQDAESDPEGTTTFQWYRADDAGGTNKTAIAGAAAATYTVQAADLGKYLIFEVIPVAQSGAATGSAVESAAVGPVQTPLYLPLIMKNP